LEWALARALHARGPGETAGAEAGTGQGSLHRGCALLG